MLRLVSITALLLLGDSALAESCPEGQARTADSAGHCCWPAQAWSRTRNVCVGIPQCPNGMKVQEQTCVVDCPEGQAVTPETAGHCCWPTQVWSMTRAVCVGIPQCPTGWVLAGDQCTAPPPVVSPPPSALPPPPPPPDSGTGSSSASSPGAAPPGEHVEKHFRGGLIGGGAGLLGAGYLISLLTVAGADVYLASSTSAATNECWSYVSNTAWIPLFGPLIAMTGLSGRYQSSSHTITNQCQNDSAEYVPGVALAAIDTILQFGGLTMLILGFVVRKDVVVAGPAQASILGVSPEWAIRVGAPGTPLGLTFSITRF